MLGLICSLSALLTLAFLPLDPPTDPIDDAGWAAAALLIVGGVAAGRWLRRHDPPPSFDSLLAASYLGLAAVALLQWLGGGPNSAYANLILLWLVATLGTHPLRRALPFLLTATVVAAAPLVYADPTEAQIKEQAASYLLWLSLSVVILLLMRYVRGQRVRLREEEREAQELARADSLTGLPNRRAFDEALEREVERARRQGSPLTVAMIDIHSFKKINDNYGHAEGDRCLHEVAEAIGGAVRQPDLCFRWGGDEFALILTDTNRAAAAPLGGRLKGEVYGHCTRPDMEPMEITFAVAELGEGMSASELGELAGMALTSAKAETRDPLEELEEPF